MKNSKIAKLKAEKAKQFRLVNQQRQDGVKEALENLYDLINGKERLEIHDRTREVEVKYDWDELIEQVKAIQPIVNIENEFGDIETALQNLKLPEQIKVKDFETLVRAVEANKPLPVELDFKPLVKAIIDVEKKIQQQSTENTAPEDYKAFRRVVKVGTRLVFDDQPTPSRGGGGGGGGEASTGLTDAQLRATPVDVNLSGGVTLDPGDIEIGAVEIKDSSSDNRTSVINSAPTTEYGVVTRNIPSGIQPVSGTVTANLGTLNGAATAANQQTDALTDTELRATPVPVSGTVSVSEPVTVDGTVALSQTGTDNNVDANITNATIAVTQSGTWDEVGINDSGNSITVDAVNLDIRDLTFAADKVDASGTVLGAGNNNIGDVDVASIAAGDNNIGNVDIVTLPGDVEADIDQIRDQIDLITPDIEEIRVDADASRVALEIMDDWDESDRAKVNPIVGQAGIQGGAGAVSANTTRVAIATDANSIKKEKGSTTTTSSVSGSASAVTLLSANSSRVKATIHNESSAVLYVKEGSAASLTSYDYFLNPQADATSAGGLAIIDDYTGIITGIWGAATGAARIGETAP